LSVRYCSKCGAERVADAAFCHKCGTSFVAPQGKDNFGLGLLLINVGAVLAATLPFLMFVGVNFFSGGAFFGTMPACLQTSCSSLLGLAWLLG
jgi:hypothetical protein